jgi:CRP-like cAMP-binding protein
MFTQLSHGVPTSRITTLRRIPMFDGLSDAALARIDSRMSETTVAEGSVLMHEGQPAREAFIIAEGRAAIAVGGRPVGSVSVGDLVGETALLDGGPRTATVVALTDLRIYVLDPAEFHTLFEDPATARWIAARLAQRLRATVVAGA